ncbi:MAG: peptidoglycan DD-metalloendopeptidase family protein [Thiobacillaceae bacterium]|nr:peptidoglycan DD-metalloendopeptidase family protein [Thiobacillaceae bacterium]MCX7672241.1 peptidoglycan DD-metalloendopeptidase family protein [Thiobacillaceae bacterium]MDW8322638.1 peptidoglycan DD-metalloendopeptidase family protein [Burkholderiales bacterium]
MSRRLRLVLLLVLATQAFGSLVGKQQELKDLRARIERLQREIEQAAGERSEAADALKQSEQRISAVNRSLHGLQVRIRALDRELAQLAAQSAHTRAELDAQRQALAALLRARHQQGEADALRLLLSGENPAEVARRLTHLRYLARARQAAMRDYRATLARLQALQAQTQERKAQLAQARSEQLRLKGELEADKRARQALLDKLSAQISRQRREVGTLVQDERRLARLVERLARLNARPAPAPKRPSAPAPPAAPAQTITEVADARVAGIDFARLQGRLALPVAGEIIARFGQPREGGGPSWKGLFIRAPAGREVRAVASGRVVFADWLRGFGNLLILDHGGGYLSLYSNAETLYKQVGEPVRAGDVIATVGNTGGQEQTGLYFELRRQGRPFDPLSWVRSGPSADRG